jgi:hypothetical protein
MKPFKAECESCMANKAVSSCRTLEVVARADGGAQIWICRPEESKTVGISRADAKRLIKYLTKITEKKAAKR